MNKSRKNGKLYVIISCVVILVFASAKIAVGLNAQEQMAQNDQQETLETD